MCYVYVYTYLFVDIIIFIFRRMLVFCKFCRRFDDIVKLKKKEYGNLFLKKIRKVGGF